MNDAMKALDALKRIGGCAAHACIIAPPQGAGTNGPCNCLDSRSKRGRIEAVFKMMRAALEAKADPWKPSNGDYDRSIHNNPDAAAWADFFMATFPDCGADRDTMVGWFANAMMAMYDSIPSTADVRAQALEAAAGLLDEAVEAEPEEYLYSYEGCCKLDGIEAASDILKKRAKREREEG